jgi:hypothetical protein
VRTATVLIALLLALASTGCGGDSGGGGPSPDTPEGAVRVTVVTWLLEGQCELMTDKFLEEQSFIGDSREERCNFFRKSFTPPSYGEDDIEVTDITITGDRATAVVGGGGVDITSKYTLAKVAGKWQIDEADLQ